MRLNEVKDGDDSPEQSGFVNAADNEYEQSKKMDTRRPRLTLEHLNKLRKMREVRKLEVEDRKQLYKKIYQRPAPTM